MNLSLQKWHLGLIIGTPVAFGIGKYLVHKMNTPSPKSPVDVDVAVAVAVAMDVAVPVAVPVDVAVPVAAPVPVAAEEEQKSPPPAEVPSAEDRSGSDQLEQEASVETRRQPHKFGGGDSVDTEYRRLVADISDYGLAMENEIKKHRKRMSALYQNRAVWNVVLKKWSNVKADTSKALEFDCRNGMAYLSRARAHDATGDLQACLSDLEAARALIRASTNPNACPQKESIETFWKRVLLQGARADAKEIMRNRDSVFPSKIRITSYMQAFIGDPLQKMSFPRPLAENEALRGFPRAHWAFHEKRFEDVIPACTEEIESLEAWSQHKTEARLMRGTFHLLCGSLDLCHQDLKAVIGDAEADSALRAYALIRSAALFFQLSRQHRAMDAFAEAERLLPDNADLYYHRGLIRNKLRQFKAALVDFEMAARLAPSHVTSVVLLHFTEYHFARREGDIERMEMALKKLCEVPLSHPKCIDAYMMTGSLLASRKDFVEALLCFEKATLLAPKNPVLMVNRAVMELKRHGNAELVIPVLYEAIELDPRCPMAYPFLVTLEIKRNNPVKAIELLNQSTLNMGSFNEVLHACTMRNALMARNVAKKNLGIQGSPTTD